MLASSDTIHPVWAQVLGDPFLRRLILRYIAKYHNLFRE
ncbi:hypothetical protein M8C21_016535 [Ambrosia artemisiifolia]|uniref:Uncharacterized protein n=1 Tax=Ambrosia artemisiifolia TaxID=4212 RepID=A0AAD5GUJ5_AMBAR|nr:hypothetical protein M8C21_016535 [Ambrosia artemisiifolia]